MRDGKREIKLIELGKKNFRFLLIVYFLKVGFKSVPIYLICTIFNQLFIN